MAAEKLVIGFMGLATAGKTTAATFLKSLDPVNIRVESFATPLKMAAKGLFLLTDEQLYGTLKDVVDPRWGVSPRYIFRKMGTDFVRQMILEDFWVRRLETIIETGSIEPVILIDDVRFEDEATMVAKYGCNVLIDRLGLWTDSAAHASEQPPAHLAEEIIHNDLDLKNFHCKVLDSHAAHLIKRRLQL